MKNLRAFIILVIISLFAVGAVSADYSFRVPRAETVVEVNADGTMDIFVEYEFENLGDKLDYIDIGLPNDNYKLGNIQATLNGEADSRIKVTKASYEDTGLRHGISLEMNGAAIPSGENAVVSVRIPGLSKNLYNASSETIDGEELAFAGFEYSPNYFSSKFTKGTTKYSFIIVFPPGAGDGFVYYYTPEDWAGDNEPSAWLDEEGRVVYEWYSESANMYNAYTFGGKFLKSVLTSESSIVSSSSGSSDGFDWYMLIGVLSCLGLPAAFIVFIVKSVKENNKIRKVQEGKYFPPQIKTDGEGIKRGLTAVEAAVLLEVDLERVISMILYGLAKKEILKVNSMDPLDVDIANPLPDNMHDYEKDFVEALEIKDSNKQKRKLRESMHRLILSVSKKMEGFSLKETREYYKNICDKAWAQVEAADTPELKSQMLGDNFGWFMLEEDPAKHVETTFSGYDFYPPTWWWRVDPGYHHPSYHSRPTPPSSGGSSEKRSSSGPSTSRPSSMPVLPGAMFARSITQSAKKLGESLTGNMTGFKAAVKGKTNPSPIYSSHRHGGGSSGGSSSSSCACACACDSCACACAGGGR